MMEANGDAAKQIWITEMGWSTYSGSGVTEAEQAQYLVKAYRRLESYPYVRAALQYNFRNSVARGETPARRPRPLRAPAHRLLAQARI